MAKTTYLTEARPRILYVDAFDSFTNSIIGLLEQRLNAQVTLVRINDQFVASNLESIVAQFDGVVIGPGPGHPQNTVDIGFVPQIWQLGDRHLLPVFGICLGFQSLCTSFQAKIEKLSRPRHGIVSTITHKSGDIFADIADDLTATQYHSLCVRLTPDDKGGGPIWEPSKSCPQVHPLAWDVSDEANAWILMGARHVEKPFWGVQFHPESICTSESGKQLIENWWSEAKKWSHIHRRQSDNQPDRDDRSSTKHQQTLLELSASSNAYTHKELLSDQSHLSMLLRSIIGRDNVQLRWGTHREASIDSARLVELLGYDRRDIILLDSQNHKSGRYSIIGIISPAKTVQLSYTVKSKTLRYGVSEGHVHSTPLSGIEELWPILQEAVDLHDPRKQGRASGASTPGLEPKAVGMDTFATGHLPEDSPFWGGFLGYISYEAGLETIDVNQTSEKASMQDDTPDVEFAFVHRSIVIDHETGSVYIQSLLPGDWTWILDVGRILDEHKNRKEIASIRQGLPTPAATPSSSPTWLGPNPDEVREKLLDAALATATISRPQEAEYRQKVLDCQDYLASGDSYELCLTDQSEISVTTALQDWELYKRLRSRNPAPFGCFLRLTSPGSSEPRIIVGSSPERFLRWTRGGTCQFRPIKGTVKKDATTTRESATAILNSSKERAENLMIVDLIRHDLSGVVGAENTWVSKLMVVEEYETVYQLVSVIEGQCSGATLVEGESEPKQSSRRHAEARGLDVLRASLPPGSMTGAPKKRSCEILQGIEKRPRGIYSGVLGYLDVGGGGDFSVVIRTLVKASGELADQAMDREPKQSRYRVGAGGAITIQSTDLGEYEEMETKASSVLGATFLR